MGNSVPWVHFRKQLFREGTAHNGNRVLGKHPTSKISRHLGRFRDWFTEGFGHDRITAVTAREITGWREHLTATVVRTLTDGQAQLTRCSHLGGNNLPCACAVGRISLGDIYGAASVIRVIREAAAPAQ